MNVFKGLGLILISIVALLTLSIFTVALVISQQSDFSGTGSAINKTIVWFVIVGAVAINGVLKGIKQLRKQSVCSKSIIDDLNNSELHFTLELQPFDLYRVALVKTFSDPLTYLFVSFFVIPQFQNTSFVEPINLVNILIISMTVLIGNLVLAHINMVVYLNWVFSGYKQVKYQVSKDGIAIETDIKIIQYKWDDIKTIKVSNSLLTITNNWIYEFHIPLKYITYEDQETIKRIMKQEK